jgi:hypothetical protein
MVLTHIHAFTDADVGAISSRQTPGTCSPTPQSVPVRRRKRLKSAPDKGDR